MKTLFSPFIPKLLTPILLMAERLPMNCDGTSKTVVAVAVPADADALVLSISMVWPTTTLEAPVKASGFGTVSPPRGKNAKDEGVVGVMTVSFVPMGKPVRVGEVPVTTIVN